MFSQLRKSRRFSSQRSPAYRRGTFFKPTVEALEPRQLLSADLTITEFVARNEEGLRDQDGDRSDWIEVFNASDAAVDLDGWYLTDDATELTKWQFPAVSLASKEYLVVFASGKDRIDHAAPLHANFQLDADGEYLALVEPDGNTVAVAFAPQFPPQEPDISFGVAQESLEITPVGVGADATILIPTVENGGHMLGTSWTEADFDDAGWLRGNNGIGYERSVGFEDHIATDVEIEMFGVNASAYLRIPFSIADPQVIFSLQLWMKYDDGFVAYLNGVEVARRNAIDPLGWDSKSLTTHRDNLAVLFEDVDVTEFKGELREGENVLAVHALNSSPNSNDFLLVAELRGFVPTAIESDVPGYIEQPTPATPNGLAVFSGVVQDVTASVERGFYEDAFDTFMTTTTSGATIVYTTDGSRPSLTNGVQIPPPDAGQATTSTVTVSGTSTLRTGAFKDGFIPSKTATHTYVFPSDVVTQDFQATLDAGFVDVWGRTEPDYGLDPDVIGPNDLFAGEFADQIIDSLTAVPSVSIVMDMDDLFGAEGIYVNSERTGFDWERPTSVEFIFPDGTADYQADAGIRIQGDNVRNFSNSKKQSFRLEFRERYGPTKLRFPLFGDEATDSFDTVILRGQYNDGWVHSPSSTQYIRDQWARSTLLEMGRPNAHGRFMHVYLNGFYWGLYNVVERPNAAFSSDYFGGDKDDWDALNTGRPRDGTADAWGELRVLSRAVDAASPVESNAAFLRLLGKNPDGSDNPEFETLLDVGNYIDYLIVNFYGGNVDWPHRNYYVGRQRGPESTGFKYYAWDTEKILDHGEGASLTTNRTGVTEGVALAYRYLRANDEFRLLFADHIHRHFFNGGALYVDRDGPAWDAQHPERNVPAARYDDLATQAELPLVGESARWGDTQSSSTRNDGRIYTLIDWRAKRDDLFANFFPRRSAIVMDQFIAAGLYPALAAPVFDQHGGEVAAGFSLSVDAPGDVYYTLDGSDPRQSALAEGVASADVSPTAMRYTAPIALEGTVTVKSRTLVAGEWSALNEATFVVGPDTPIVVTEINYNPLDPTAAELEADAGLDSDDFEFVELRNVSAATVDLAGYRFTDGIEFTFPNYPLAPGEFGVVVRNQQAFALRYGDDVNPIGEFDDGRLSNNGEQVRLVNSLAATVLAIEYRDSDPWPERADGAGGTLELFDIATELGQQSKHYSWRGSTDFGGSPGSPGSSPLGVVINEVITNTDELSDRSDSIELLNATASTIDISRWYLSDAAGDLQKFAIPDGTLLDPGEYLVFDEQQFNPQPDNPGENDFALSGIDGDDVWLVVPNETGGIRSFVDDVHFGALAVGEAWGRLPNATGRLAPLARGTLGNANYLPRVGPLVISELNYQPGDPSPAAHAIDPNLVADDLEFIEIHNPTQSTVDLSNWRIRGGVEFEFDQGTNINAGETLTILSFNPDNPENAARLDAFRTNYGLDNSVTLLGGYGGQLNDDGERVQLQRGAQLIPLQPTVVSHLYEDEIAFDNLSPWSTNAAGGGDSLGRSAPVFFGNFSQSWSAGPPTPGSVDFAGNTLGDLTGDGAVTVEDVDVLQYAAAAESEVSYYDLDDNSIAGDTDVTFLIENVIGTFMGDSQLDGRVDATDLNQVGINWRRTDVVSWNEGDFNGDGHVDTTDLNLIVLNWQNGVPNELVTGLEPRQSPADDLVISEFLASNDNGIRDKDHTRSDWIEILNTADTEVNLNGWFLTDDPDDLDQWRFPNVSLGAGERMAVFASGKNYVQPGSELHTNFQLDVAGEYLALVEPDGVSIAHDFSPRYPAQLRDVSFGLPQQVNEETLLEPGATVQVLVPTPDNGGDLLAQSWTAAAFDDSTWIAGATGVGYERTRGYEDLIATDVEAQMFGVNSTVYLRLPFSVEEPSVIFSLTLGVQYDDGYVAYINGQEVARRNAPAELTWNAAATEQHRDRDAAVFEDAQIDVGRFADLLSPGENLLAIHALNNDPSSSDFVIVPRLVAREFGELLAEDRQYFTAPSHAEPNGFDTTTVLVDVSHAPNVPSEEDDLTVTATVSTTGVHVAPIMVHYRVMYDDEVSLIMLDDGLHGDGEADDGVYGATIPAGIASTGQMIRYRITAGETASNFARSPLFIGPLDHEEYHGTMVTDPTIASGLPVIHLFLQAPDAADTTAGTNGSLFYDGELYDNIHIDSHGHTTLGFDKKSKDIFFPRDHRFRISDDVPRLKDINILTNYGDPTMLRNTLAYGSYRNIGTPAHMAFPIRVQQNGDFLGVFDYVEDGDDEFLEREGLDPRGALYKMDNLLDSASTGLEKKTRTEEDNADIQALIDGVRMTGTDRSTFLFDSVNIPAMVNYLAGLVLTGETDCCRRNYYAFRDTDWTGLWRYLPWDVDKSFGKTDTFSGDWSVGTGNLFSGRGNTLITALFDTPDIRAMYLRRVRTVLDEFLQPVGTPADELKFERWLDELAGRLASDVPLDIAAWGSIDDSLTWGEHVELHKNEYFPARRNFIYSSLTQANGGTELAPQAGAPQILFGTVEYNPRSGNQAEEFIELSNPNDVAVDISGWQLSGGVQHVFHPGTVLPAGHTLYVSPDINAFKARASAPTGGQRLFVQGNYVGHISNHGATIQLIAADATVVDEIVTPVELTPTQQFLRISEIMYHPRDSQTGIRFEDDDYEFIELTNTSSTDSLDLENIELTKGIQFTFPPMTMAPGQSVVVVRDEAAFVERYGAGITIVGQYGDTAQDYKLSNGGESLRLEIAAGDPIQQFSYDDQWYLETDGGGSSLEFIDPSRPDLQGWNIGEAWRSSASVGGSPGRQGILGDFSGDGLVDATDIDQLQAEVRAQTHSLGFDLTNDGLVNQDDVSELVLNVLNTQFGDADLDGDIDATDLNQIGVNWRRTDAASWAHGDFNNDGRVDTLDLNELTSHWRHAVIMPAQASPMNDRLPKPLIRTSLDLLARRQSPHDLVDQLFANLAEMESADKGLRHDAFLADSPRNFGAMWHLDSLRRAQ